MARQKRSTRIDFRLAASQYDKLLDRVRLSKRTRAQYLREAVSWFMDHEEAVDRWAIEQTYSDKLDRGINRICALLAKQAIDLKTLAGFVYNCADDDARETYGQSYASAVKRIKEKLTQDEQEIANKLRRTMQ